MKSLFFAILAGLPAAAATCDQLSIQSPADGTTFSSNRTVLSVCVPAGVHALKATVTTADPTDASKTKTISARSETFADGVDHWSPELFLAKGSNTITVSDAGNPNLSARITVVGTGLIAGPDTRETFDATFFVGASIDSFASSNTRQYLGYTSADSGPQTGYVAGIDFAYRLFRRDPYSHAPLQLWVFGETVHGQRSAEVNCSGGTNVATPQCLSFGAANAANQFLAILRNSSSLEGFTGLRLEFLKFNRSEDYSANLYVKSQLGFLTVQNNGAGVLDDHTKLAVGTIMTNGAFRDSYLEAGWGKTDLFAIHRGRRFKVDGYVQWKVSGKVPIYPFFQLVVDSDFGPGADDVRTFYGINLDIRNLSCLFGSKTCTQ